MIKQWLSNTNASPYVAPVSTTDPTYDSWATVETSWLTYTTTDDTIDTSLT